MKKILISSNNAWNLVNFRLNLIKKLKKKYEIIILVNRNEDYAKILKKNGFELHFIHLNSRSRNVIENLLLLKDFYFIFKKIKPDYFLGFTIKPNILGSIIANLFNVKIINNITGLGNSFIKGGIIKFIIINLYRIALKKSKIIFFHNISDQLIFINNNITSYNNSCVIPGSGIDLNKYKYFELRENKKKFNFLYFGRIITDKGILILLEVIEKLKNDKRIKFTIIGSLMESDKNYKKIKKLIQKRSNSFEYINFSNNINQHILNSDCVILPSYREGLPRSLLEASALGVPIIASNVPGCTHLVKNGYNGIIFEKMTAESLLNKIIYFLKLDYKTRLKISKNARLHIEKYYNESIVINKYIEYIENNNEQK